MTGRIWTHLAIVEPATILSSPSPAVSGDIVVTGFSSGEVVSLRVANGTVNWEDMLSRAGQLTPLSDLNPIVGRPVIDRDRVFAASHGGRMVSIDLRTGERVWMAEVKSIETPWVAGDNLFLVTTDAKVICLSEGRGAFAGSHNYKIMRMMITRMTLYLGQGLFLLAIGYFWHPPLEIWFPSRPIQAR